MPTFEDPHTTGLWAVSFSVLMCCLSPANAQTPSTPMQSSPVVTLRTLAQIQQWQDEMNLRDRIDTLQDKLRNRNTERGRMATLASPVKADIAADGAGTGRRQPIQNRRRPALKLLSVYGPAHRLSAEAMDAGGNVHAIEERDTVGAWVVNHIRQEGILLHRDGKGSPEMRGIFLAVGESIHEPAGESGAGSASESVNGGVRP